MKTKLKPESGRPLRSALPIKTRKFHGHAEDNLKGRTFSYLKVTGYYGPGNGANWVCECLCCGWYEVRKAAKLREQRSDRDYFCSECENEITRQTSLGLLGWVAA